MKTISTIVAIGMRTLATAPSTSLGETVGAAFAYIKAN